MSVHALRYTHAKTCPGEGASSSEPAECKEEGYDQKLIEMRTREPARVNEEFMERLREAAMAFQELERLKHSKLVRNFYRH